jgi:hypothetical protein
MDLIHIFVLIFGLFAFSRALLRWRENKITLGEFLFWSAIWISALLFALFPGTLSLLSNKAGFRRGMDFVIAVSIIVLFYLLFRVYVVIDEIDQNITRVVREIAMKKKK